MIYLFKIINFNFHIDKIQKNLIFINLIILYILSKKICEIIKI